MRRHIIYVKFGDKFSPRRGGWIRGAAPLRELVLLGTKLEQRASLTSPRIGHTVHAYGDP